jgi:hypothetical protein
MRRLRVVTGCSIILGVCANRSVDEWQKVHDRTPESVRV